MRATSWMAIAVAAVLAAPAGTALAADGAPEASTQQFSTRPDIDPDYFLGKDDVLDLSVVKFPQLDGTVTVRPDGKISVKLIGDVQAAGRTIEQVRGEITERMKAYIPDPHVALAVKALNSMRVYVLGRVGAPGMFTVGSNVNLLQALALAKGFTPWAHKSKVVLVRGTTGKRVHVDFQKVVSGRQENYVLYPGDTIVVP